METKLPEVDTRPEESGIPGPNSSNKILPFLGGVSLAAWGLLILAGLLGWVEDKIDLNARVNIGLVAFTGFYLACGNARWWVRWLLVGVSLLLTTLTANLLLAFRAAVFFGVLIMISAGFTYACRMIISAWRGESNPRQRFTIFSLMVVTGMAAVCLAALNFISQAGGLDSIALAIASLVILGFAMAAQCVPVWTRTRREALIATIVALALTLPAAFLVYAAGYFGNNSPPPLGDIIYRVTTVILFVWLILYPLWFGFYALGWTLIDPGWKLGPRYEAAAPTESAEPQASEDDFDVLMEDPSGGN